MADDFDGLNQEGMREDGASPKRIGLSPYISAQMKEFFSRWNGGTFGSGRNLIYDGNDHRSDWRIQIAESFSCPAAFLTDKDPFADTSIDQVEGDDRCQSGEGCAIPGFRG